MEEVFLVSKEETEIDWEEHAFDTPEKIIVEDGNRRYRSVNDCLMEKESGMLAAACVNSILPTDGSLQSLGPWSFSRFMFNGLCIKMNLLILPDSVKEIGEGAFSVCSDESVHIIVPDSVRKVDRLAFMIYLEEPDERESDNRHITITFLGDRAALETGVFGTAEELKNVQDPIIRSMPENVCADISRLSVQGPADSDIRRYCERYGIHFQSIVA